MIKKIVGLLAAVMIGAGGLLLLAKSGLLPADFIGRSTDDRNEQIITSITREEQISLVRLGIQGIDKQTSQSTIFGMDIAGSEREAFIQYGFDAKLGIEGADVVIRQIGEDKFRLTVPSFIFIGYENVSFESVAESAGVLSWTTPEVDQIDMINNILNADTKQHYVDSNQQLLRDQTEFFYGSILSSIDPDIDLEFEYVDDTVHTRR